jgi:hypothetical protein
MVIHKDFEPKLKRTKQMYSKDKYCKKPYNKTTAVVESIDQQHSIMIII